MAPRPIPLVPDRSAIRLDTYQAFHRSLAAHVLGRALGQSPDALVRKTWPDDTRTAVLRRAAVSPTDTTSGAALTATKVSPLLLVAPGSAAARLFENCVKFDLTGVQQFFIPHVN